MKIAEIRNNQPAFCRKPNVQEMQIYTNSLNEGLRLLHKQVDIIIHNSAAPAIPKENTGIGSLFSRTVQEKLIPFLKAHGFTGIQQEPNNLRKAGDPSPYAPESSAKNIFMIPLEKLSTIQYDEILPREIFRDMFLGNTSKTEVNYDEVNRRYDFALKYAYKNFKLKNATGLKIEFQQFKNRVGNSLEKAAIFQILDRKYLKAWNEWEGIDKNLYAPRNEKEAEIAKARIAELKKQYKDEIDFFMFKQFLIEKENVISNKLAEETGVKIIGDSPVASPAADEWINQDLFLEGKALGCPPDAFSKDGQRWGFKYFNPKYIFNPDGTLGKAGKLLKEKYDSFFASFPGGLRIDHVIGLVDPFVYDVLQKITSKTQGRIYSVGEFKKKPEEYSNILEKIVLQSAKEHGMDKSNIICEDLGEPNLPTQKVMKKLDLSGISVTQFDYRGAETPERNVIMIGSHDNESFIEYTDKFFAKVQGKNIEPKKWYENLRDKLTNIINKEKNTDEDLAHFLRKTEMLAEDTAPKGASKKEIKEYRQQIRSNKNKFMEASFAELFTSPARRVQIFFADFWGIGKTYNRPGTSSGNWSLRIGSDFEKDYYNAVAEGKAPNLAKAVATALRQRGLDKEHQTLVKNLDDSAKILSEV